MTHRLLLLHATQVLPVRSNKNSAGPGEAFVIVTRSVYAVITLPIVQDPFSALKGNVMPSTMTDMLDCETSSLWERLSKSQNVSLDFQTTAVKEKEGSGFVKDPAKRKLDFLLLSVDHIPH